MIALAPPSAWTLAAAGRAWGVTRERVRQFVGAGRVPSAYREPGGAWRIPVGAPKPEPRETGRPRRQRAA